MQVSIVVFKLIACSHGARVHREVSFLAPLLVPPCACPTIFRHGEQTATIVFWAKSLVVIRNAPHRHLRFVRRVPKSINFLPSRAWGEVTFLATHTRFKQHFGRFLGFFPSGACTPRGVLFGNIFRPTVSVSGDFRKRPAARGDSFFFEFPLTFSSPKVKSPLVLRR